MRMFLSRFIRAYYSHIYDQTVLKLMTNKESSIQMRLGRQGWFLLKNKFKVGVPIRLNWKNKNKNKNKKKSGFIKFKL